MKKDFISAAERMAWATPPEKIILFKLFYAFAMALVVGINFYEVNQYV